MHIATTWSTGTLSATFTAPGGAADTTPLWPPMRLNGLERKEVSMAILTVTAQARPEMRTTDPRIGNISKMSNESTREMPTRKWAPTGCAAMVVPSQRTLVELTFGLGG